MAVDSKQEWAQLCWSGLKRARESGSTDLLLALKEIRLLLSAEPQQCQMLDPQVVEELLAIALEGLSEPRTDKTVAALLVMLEGLEDKQLTDCFSNSSIMLFYTDVVDALARKWQDDAAANLARATQICMDLLLRLLCHNFDAVLPALGNKIKKLILCCLQASLAAHMLVQKEQENEQLSLRTRLARGYLTTKSATAAAQAADILFERFKPTAVHMREFDELLTGIANAVETAAHKELRVLYSSLTFHGIANATKLGLVNISSTRRALKFVKVVLDPFQQRGQLPIFEGMEKDAFISTYLKHIAVGRRDPEEMASRIEVEDKAFSGRVVVEQFSVVVKSVQDAQEEHFEVPLYCLKAASYDDSHASLQLMLAPEDCNNFSFEEVETVTLDMDFHDQSRLAEFSEALGRVVNPEGMEGPDQDLLDELASPNEKHTSAAGGDGSEQSSGSTCQSRKMQKTNDFSSTKDLEELVPFEDLSAHNGPAQDITTSSASASITSTRSQPSQLIINTELTAYPPKSQGLRVEFASTKDLETGGVAVTWPIPQLGLHDGPRSSDCRVVPGTCVQNEHPGLKSGTTQGTDVYSQTGHAPTSLADKPCGQHTQPRQSQETEALVSLEGASCFNRDVGVTANQTQASTVNIGLGAPNEGETYCTVEDTKRVTPHETQSKVTMLDSSITQHTLLSAASPATTARRDCEHTPFGQQRLQGSSELAFVHAGLRVPPTLCGQSPGAHGLPRGLHGCRSSFPSPFADIRPRKKRTYTQGSGSPTKRSQWTTSARNAPSNSHSIVTPAHPDGCQESVVRLLLRATESIEDGKLKLLNRVHGEFKNAEDEIQQKFHRLIECQRASFAKLAVNVEAEKQKILERMRVLPECVPDFNLEFKHPALRAVLAGKDADTEDAAGNSVEEMIRSFRKESQDKLRGVKERVLRTRVTDA